VVAACAPINHFQQLRDERRLGMKKTRPNGKKTTLRPWLVDVVVDTLR
jgi:hypothetical protein